MFALVCTTPHVEVSKLVGSHMKAGTPLAAGNHHKGFSDPLLLKKAKKKGQFHDNSIPRHSKPTVNTVVILTSTFNPALIKNFKVLVLYLNIFCYLKLPLHLCYLKLPLHHIYLIILVSSRFEDYQCISAIFIYIIYWQSD